MLFHANSGRAGRSWGCPALDPKVSKGVIDKIRNGGLLDGILEKTRMIMRRVQILPGRARQLALHNRARER